MEVIRVMNASKSFCNHKVLNDVSLSCETGKIYGIVGYNGSGKTVLFKWCLLSKLKTLDFTDFCPIFWYNDCKDFDKNKSFFLQFSYRF